MTDTQPMQLRDVAEAVDEALHRLGHDIIVALPLGLGKANHFINELFQRAVAEPRINLTICSALSLEKPRWSTELERRFLEPFVHRNYDGCVDLAYMRALRTNSLPPNVTVKEFYTKPGSCLNVLHIQQNYISVNYTHASRDLVDGGVNLVAQMVCRGTVDGQERFSLSCNPDLMLDVAKGLRRQQRCGRKVFMVAEVNQNLPFMYGDAVVEPRLFDLVLDNPSYSSRLFGAPKMSVSDADYLIGLYASSLIKDGGTLQIGIGSLGDAIVANLKLRHQHNERYRSLLEEVEATTKFRESIESVGGTGRFEQGLSGCTEMLIDGYLDLIREGIVKRRTYDHVALQRLLNEGALTEEVTGDTLRVLLDQGVISARLAEADLELLTQFGILRPGCHLDENGQLCLDGWSVPADLGDPQNLKAVATHALGARLRGGILVYGGFFLGPESFYAALSKLSEEERRAICMTSVLRTNHLYDDDYASEELKVLQRPHGRFVNTCLMVTLNGGIVSDALDSGKIVSGVGGQYNFVAQAHDLPGGRSILMCRSTRSDQGQLRSNLVYNYGHITVPRHLRDIVVTEYGIADLRHRSDQEIIAALLNITDSRFQAALLKQAQEAGKISRDYRIPDAFRNNTPASLTAVLRQHKKAGFFQPFPMGTDFTAEELTIAKALKRLKTEMGKSHRKIKSIGQAAAIRSVPPAAEPYLRRMDLADPDTAKDKMMQKLVIHALKLSGALRAIPN